MQYAPEPIQENHAVRRSSVPDAVEGSFQEGDPLDVRALDQRLLDLPGREHDQRQIVAVEERLRP